MNKNLKSQLKEIQWINHFNQKFPPITIIQPPSPVCCIELCTAQAWSSAHAVLASLTALLKKKKNVVNVINPIYSFDDPLVKKRGSLNFLYQGRGGSLGRNFQIPTILLNFDHAYNP